MKVTHSKPAPVTFQVYRGGRGGWGARRKVWKAAPGTQSHQHLLPTSNSKGQSSTTQHQREGQKVSPIGQLMSPPPPPPLRPNPKAISDGQVRGPLVYQSQGTGAEKSGRCEGHSFKSSHQPPTNNKQTGPQEV